MNFDGFAVSESFLLISEGFEQKYYFTQKRTPAVFTPRYHTGKYVGKERGKKWIEGRKNGKKGKEMGYTNFRNGI